MSKPSWVDDDIKVWKIVLCRSCLAGYDIDDLSERIKSSLMFLRWSPIMFIGSLVGMKVLDFIMNSQGVQYVLGFGVNDGHPLGMLASLTYVAASLPLLGLFYVSILGALYNLLRYLFNSRRLRMVKASRSIHPSKVNDAFKGEAQWIINILEIVKDQDIIGRFDLPKLQERSEHLHGKNEPADKYYRIHQDYAVASVAKTHSELKKCLSADRKKLLESLEGESDYWFLR